MSFEKEGSSSAYHQHESWEFIMAVPILPFLLLDSILE